MAPAIKGQAFSVAFGTVSFFMTYGKRKIRVEVGHDMLARINGFPQKAINAHMEWIRRHRSQLAQIAAAKYDEGNYEHELKVVVVRISMADVLEQMPTVTD